MLRIVAYDIADPRRLRRVARTCLDYGVRIEKSVFECCLDEQDFKSFIWELGRIIDGEEDRVVCYPVCAACEAEVSTLGCAARGREQELMVF